MESKTIASQLLALPHFTKVDLSGQLGISRPTLDTRLEKHNWKKGESKILEDLYERFLKTT